MHNWSAQEPYNYVAYIDESGDTGLTTVKPIDENGASEWLVVGAAVISADHELEVPEWVGNIVSHFRNHQQLGFHFVDLNPAKKRVVCSAMATRPLRIFALASNKKNMRGYKNPFAAMIPSNNWFYCWLTRLLLERVTLFVKEHSVARYGEPKKLKIEYSNRGGLSYAQMNAYYSWLKFKSSNRRPFLPLGNLSWEVMHPSLLEVYEHNSRAGLHFADAVAASFFKACDKHDTGECDPQFTKLFLPRMARHPDKASGRISGFGLKLMPGLRKANLDSDQTEIFRFYGYPGQWWAPDPTVP